MTLNFPSSPTNGQIYENYIWNATDSVWQGLANQVVTALISNTPTGSYTDGGVNYEYVSFTSSGTLTVTRGGLCDVLVVGGGGSGGVMAGGGGGAGGHLYIENAFLPAGNLDVTVGVGGVATQDVSPFGNPGSNGEASRVHTYYAPGGGAGAGCVGKTSDNDYRASKGLRGGSGGGASSGNAGNSASGGAGFSGLGNAGGNSTTALISCGGGGGASAVGGNGVASPLNGGVGGAGLANSITGTSVTRAAGGGGAGYDAGGAGGAGGGGNGGTGYATTNATAGTANTGSGGGGAMRDGIGGAGGSGVVIVRWVA